MIRRNIMFALIGALGLASAAVMVPNAASASESLPASVADRLGNQPVEFTQSAASQRRHMMIEQNMRAQRGYGRGYGPRRAYGPPRGYGPRGYGPPRGPRYEYRRGY